MSALKAYDCYLVSVAREPDPSRKTELLAQIVEYLLDKPLATVTFRTLAHALGVSTFTLVYHFGSRAELLSEIVGAISGRENDIQAQLSAEPPSLDAYFSGLEQSWQWSIQPRNRQLQRLEFEAAMMEAVDPGPRSYTRALYERWQAIGRDALLALGCSEADAEAESRLTVSAMFGLQYDLIVNEDVEAATAAFRAMLDGHRRHLESLVRQG